MRRIAISLLAILDYLSSLNPPVVHRDVKPENIVIENGQSGGSVYLIDFGGVQVRSMFLSVHNYALKSMPFIPIVLGLSISSTVGQLNVCSKGIATDNMISGSTIVGTYGYMAPEQFRGEAQPASDLYGLGATLLFLLSGQFLLLLCWLHYFCVSPFSL